MTGPTTPEPHHQIIKADALRGACHPTTDNPPMTKPLAHSYSSIKQFENCARQYHLVRILRQARQEESEAQRYGTEAHKAMENFLMDGTPLPPKFQQFAPYVEAVSRARGDMWCEAKLGIRADFSPCEFFARDVWFRGVPDVLVVDRHKARVADWKFGKSSRFADPDQLELMAAMTMAHYPQVQEVRGTLLFVVANAALQRVYTRHQLPEIFSRWAGRAARIDAALASGVWNPRKGPLCAYCPVSPDQCEFKE